MIEKSHSPSLLQGKNTSGLVKRTWQGVGVTINVANLIVEAGSTISVDGQGLLEPPDRGRERVTNSAMPPRLCACAMVEPAAAKQSGAPGGSTYGSAVAPADLGSGGGNESGRGLRSKFNRQRGGRGGSIDGCGNLAARWNDQCQAHANLPPRLGGGAGGLVYVTATTLTGSGSLAPNGADAAT